MDSKVLHRNTRIPNPTGFTASVGNTLTNAANVIIPANCSTSIGVTMTAGLLGDLITGGPVGGAVWGAAGYAGARASCDTSGGIDLSGFANDAGQVDMANSARSSW